MALFICPVLTGDLEAPGFVAFAAIFGGVFTNAGMKPQVKNQLSFELT